MADNKSPINRNDVVIAGYKALKDYLEWIDKRTEEVKEEGRRLSVKQPVGETLRESQLTAESVNPDFQRFDEESTATTVPPVGGYSADGEEFPLGYAFGEAGGKGAMDDEELLPPPVAGNFTTNVNIDEPSLGDSQPLSAPPPKKPVDDDDVKYMTPALRKKSMGRR